MPETLKEMRARHAREIAAKVKKPDNRVIAQAVLAMVSAETGLSEERIRSKDRSAPAYQARQKCYTLCRWAGMSYYAIGKCFDRDHSTVRAGVKVRLKHLAEKLSGPVLKETTKGKDHG